MLGQIIIKRENHLKNYPEFNILEQYNFNIDHMVNWSKIIALQNSKLNLPFRVLELGTKRSITSSSTHKKNYFNDIPNLEYIMTDYQEGLDVNIVCDLHKTENVFENEYFDLILSFSTFEHLKYPQLCAHNLMKMLKINGRIFIQTHQTFPLHGYKYDYYRFSREALKSIFSKKMNFNTITSYFNGNCAIIPHNKMNVWNDVAESYLNVIYIGEKNNTTPENYIYDIDSEN